MDKENVVLLHNGILYSAIKNEDMQISGKYMELENIILSEVAQEHTCGM